MGMGGLLAELALIAHYEDAAQWVPLVLLPVGLLALVIDYLSSSDWTRLILSLIHI